MNNNIPINSSMDMHRMVKPEEEADQFGLVKSAEGLLMEARTDISKAKVMSMPIAQLATLGAEAASLLPALRTVTQTMEINTQGLYQLANAAVGDTLKVAKSGNFYGALKTAGGASKLAQLKAAGPVTATSTVVAPIQPATILMAVVFYQFMLLQINTSGIKNFKNIIAFLLIGG